MAEQVSRMACEGLSASLMRLLLNFLAWCPGRSVVSRMKGTRLMCGYLSNFHLFSSLGHVTHAAFAGCRNESWAA